MSSHSNTRLNPFTSTMPKLLRVLSNLSSRSGSPDTSPTPTPLPTPPASTKKANVTIKDPEPETGYFPASDAFINTTSNKEIAFIKRTSSFQLDQLVVGALVCHQDGLSDYASDCSAISVCGSQISDSGGSLSSPLSGPPIESNSNSNPTTDQAADADSLGNIQQIRILFQGHMNFRPPPKRRNAIYLDADQEIIFQDEKMIPAGPSKLKSTSTFRPLRPKRVNEIYFEANKEMLFADDAQGDLSAQSDPSYVGGMLCISMLTAK